MYSISNDDNRILDSQIKIFKQPKLLSKSFGQYFEEEGEYILSFCSSDSSKLFMSVFEGTEISVSGGVDIYISEKKVAQLISKIVVEQIGRFKDDYTYLEGLINSFTGKTDNAGTLKHTYLNTQNDYEISSLVTSGDHLNQQLSFECELSADKQVLSISGLVNNISVADSSLYFGFAEFIAQNMGAVVSAVFTAFIITCIPLMLSRKVNSTP